MNGNSDLTCEHRLSIFHVPETASGSAPKDDIPPVRNSDPVQTSDIEVGMRGDRLSLGLRILPDAVQVDG